MLLNTSGQSATAAVTAVATSRGPGVLGQGDGISVGLVFGAPVTVQGAPVLRLNDGGSATYDAAASSPTFLVFDHVVAGLQATPALAVGSVSLAGGASITDAAGAPAGLAGAVTALPGLSVDTSGSADAVGALRGVWQGVFARDPTPDELAVLQGYLRSGLAVGQIRANAAMLPEATADVNQAFAFVLNRQPTTIEFNATVQTLANGQQTEAGLRAGLAAGPESQANLNQFSLDILGHPLSAADAAASTALLAQGASLGVARTTLALGAEAQADIAATYQAYLGRAPGAQEAYVSTVQLASGLNQAGVAFQAMALASTPAVQSDAGSATLYGTPGADVFVVGSNAQDTIVAFDFTRDLIQVSRAMVPNWAAVARTERPTGSGLAFNLDAQHEVYVQGVQLNQLFAANIQFT